MKHLFDPLKKNTLIVLQGFQGFKVDCVHSKIAIQAKLYTCTLHVQNKTFKLVLDCSHLYETAAGGEGLTTRS